MKTNANIKAMKAVNGDVKFSVSTRQNVLWGVISSSQEFHTGRFKDNTKLYLDSRLKIDSQKVYQTRDTQSGHCQLGLLSPTFRNVTPGLR